MRAADALSQTVLMEPDPLNIGRYRVAREIGSGAMGRVYLAEDPLLKRSVAIKVVHAELANNPDFIRRFETDAQAVAAYLKTLKAK